MQDRSTLRRIEQRTTKEFSGVWRDVQSYAEHVPRPIETVAGILEYASFVLLLDATYVRVRGQERWVHIAYDTAVGVVDFWIDDTENKTAYGYILARLEQVGYVPLCIVSDEHTSLVSLVADAGIPHQYCLFHVLQSLCRLLNHGKIRKSIPIQHQVLYARLSGILKTTSIRAIPDRVRALRALQRHFTHPTQRKALLWFWKTLPNAITHLSFDEGEVPRTNNLLENLNGQIKQRLKTFRGVKSEKSLYKILTLLFHFRKFKP